MHTVDVTDLLDFRELVAKGEGCGKLLLGVWIHRFNFFNTLCDLLDGIFDILFVVVEGLVLFQLLIDANFALVGDIIVGGIFLLALISVILAALLVVAFNLGHFFSA